MNHPDASNAPEALDAEIAALAAAASLPDLAARLNTVTDAQRERLFVVLAALADNHVRRWLDLTLTVGQLLPAGTLEQVERDVGFLLAAVPSPDADHEALLLRFLADPRDVAWKAVYADFLEERGDPRAAAMRAEVAAVEAGMPPDAVCGVLDAQRHLGVAYTPEDLGTLGVMPFSPKTLRQCKDTHVLVAGAPLSLNDISARAANAMNSAGDWYHDEPFASVSKVDARWYLLRKEPVPGSSDKTYAEQAALLTDDEEVPRACVMAYMAILHSLAHRDRLFQGVYVRCQDAPPAGMYRASIGFFTSSGFEVLSYENDNRRDYLGLASSRKS